MPDSWTGLGVALLAVVPGFIAATTWARARTWKGPSGDLRTILQSLAFSVAIQILVAPLTLTLLFPFREDLESHPWRVAVWSLFAVLLVPVSAGIAAAKITDLAIPPSARPWSAAPRGWRGVVGRLVPRVPPPSAWDTFFLTQPPHGQFLVVHFKDGRRIGGVFADGSVAMTSPDPAGLYLSSEWVLDDDGDFVAEVPESAGVLIPHTDEVLWVRLQKPPSG